MAELEGGSGALASARELTAMRRRLGVDIPDVVDLNKTPPAILREHPQIGKALAAKISAARRRGRIDSPADLFHRRAADPAQLRVLEQISFGRLPVRPLVTGIATQPKRLYTGRSFAVRISFLRSTLVKLELLTVWARFPSGAVKSVDVGLGDAEREAGEAVIDRLTSAEGGELFLVVTGRDAEGGVSERSASFGVFPRNPVQMYVTPSFWTQSGTVGAPKYDFSTRRWHCFASVRWVNGTGSRVNLGRTVTVRMTDAGAAVGTFSFNLSGDIVIPAWSTVYGNIETWHDPGSRAHDVYSNKGDLTYRYTMSGSGHTVEPTQIWRAMRVLGYNIIRVGDFSNTERNEYRRAAAEVASGIYQSRDMTVHDVELYRIEGTPALDADKARFRFIDSQAEINDLRARYTVNNWFLDVFFVEGRWDGAFGSSPVNGPVDKEGGQSGLVIRRDSDTTNLGQTFAHEGGHYLGLEHADENDGCADTDPSDSRISDNFIFSSSRRDSRVITRCQIDKMRRHGLVRALTP